MLSKNQNTQKNYTMETTKKQFCGAVSLETANALDALKKELNATNAGEMLTKLVAEFAAQKMQIAALKNAPHPFRSELTLGQQSELVILQMLKGEKQITQYAVAKAVTTERGGQTVSSRVVNAALDLYAAEIAAHREKYPDAYRNAKK